MGNIGIYLGTPSDDVSNIQNVVKTWVSPLTDADYEIDLIGGANVPNEILSEVTLCGVSHTQTRTPFAKIWNSYAHVSHYISNHNPDVVIQLWKYQTHAPAVSMAGKMKGVPSVVRFTGDVFSEFQGYEFPYSAGVFTLGNVIGRIPLRTASKTVVLGPNLRESVLSRGADEQDVHVVPPPRPDEDRFSPTNNTEKARDELGLDPDRPVALFVGRIAEQKGMPFLETVIEETLPQTDLQFVLVGAGPYRDKLRDRFSSERVQLPGYVSRHQIGKYYEAASVYVHPSRFEGIPLVILEALQSGIPVIAREAGDVDFVVKDVVKTEQQMIDRLVQREWNSTWQNESYFSSSYQRSEITGLVDDLVQ